MELKPCPFCGGDGAVSISVKDRIIFGNCWDCGARGPAIKYSEFSSCPSDDNFADAVEEWNGRVDNG